jgi:hypothetical protein
VRWIGNSITPMQRAKAVENKNRILEEAIKARGERGLRSRPEQPRAAVLTLSPPARASSTTWR